MNKEKSKLVVVDMQEGFRYQESEAIIAEIRLAIDIFAGSLLFAKFINREDSLFHTQLNWEKMRDSSDTKLFSQFKDYEDSSFEHYTYSILNDDLRAIIEREGISRIYLAGVLTSASLAVLWTYLMKGSRPSLLAMPALPCTATATMKLQ
jgi:nicotinamidase-related amidase